MDKDKAGDDSGSSKPNNSPDGDGKGGEESTATIGKVLEMLQKIDIVLPDDTNGSNFLDRIYTALLTAVAIGDDGMAENQPSQDTTVVDPHIATMSLQARQALAFGEKQHRSAVKADLDALLSSGRCTPAEHAEKLTAIGVMKLSLTETGDPEKSSVETWIESRQPVPAGAFWDDSQKLQKLSLANHPDPVNFSDSGEKVDYDKAADFVLGK